MPRTATAIIAGLLLCCASTAVASTPAPRDGDHAHLQLSIDDEAALLRQMLAASPHRRALAAAKVQVGALPPGDLGVVTTLQPLPIGATFAGTIAKAQPAKPGRRSYGYLPYWTQSGAKLHWKTLTQIAWFCAEIDATGKVTDTHGWGGPSAKAWIQQAHANGVQVPLAVTLFSQSGISAVLATDAKRQALADTLISLVLAGGGDGLSIDFEGMAVADKAKMVDFTARLRKGLDQALPGADLTLATPAVDWTGAWDYDVLAEGSDGLFIMAYGLHWGGGAPGPNLPMAKGAPWTHKTLPWVIDDYVKYGKASNIHKFIVGLPLYGNAWPSDSDLPGAAALGKGKSVTYEAAIAAAPGKGGWKWDDASQSSWYVSKEAGNWVQTWVDNLTSLQLRVDYVDTRDAQIGYWALGYADKDEGVWAMFEAWRAKGLGGGGGGSTDADGGGGSDAGGSDTAQADTAQADTAQPDTAQPDTAQADTAQADTAQADTAQADTAQPDTAQADTAQPDTAQPDTAQADTEIAATDAAPDDSAAIDAATAQDAATSPATAPQALAAPASSGCSAHERSAAPTSAWLWLLASLLLWMHPGRREN